MRPLEMQLELSSHLWMYNRLKEMLAREGLIGDEADDGQIREAVQAWLAMVSAAQRRDLFH